MLSFFRNCPISNVAASAATTAAATAAATVAATSAVTDVASSAVLEVFVWLFRWLGYWYLNINNNIYTVFVRLIIPQDVIEVMQTEASSVAETLSVWSSWIPGIKISVWMGEDVNWVTFHEAMVIINYNTTTRLIT